MRTVITHADEDVDGDGAQELGETSAVVTEETGHLEKDRAVAQGSQSSRNREFVVVTNTARSDHPMNAYDDGNTIVLDVIR
ncbi:MAG: hypothetical protein ACOH2Q_13335, partial [Rhodococcus sp. (in: high G+C Gram-positive bacteria)]